MKYKDFIAKAAIQIMAQQCQSFGEEQFTEETENGTIVGPSTKVKNTAYYAVIAAKALAEELEEDFVYPDKDLELNHKMSDYESFFDSYNQ